MQQHARLLLFICLFFSAGAIVFEPTVITAQTVSGTTSTTSVKLNNNGATTFTYSATITGPDASSFSPQSFSGDLVAGAMTTLNFTFSPLSAGVKYANFTLTDGTNIPIRGLSTKGIGGDFEPSLQWIVDTFTLPYQVGDDDPTTVSYNSDPALWRQFPRGPEVVGKVFYVADVTKNVTAYPIAAFGPASDGDTVFVGVCANGTNSNCFEIFSIGSQYNNTIYPVYNGLSTFVNNFTQGFSLFSRWPFFGTRGDNGRVYQEDNFNTFPNALPHHVRVYPFVTPQNVTIPYSYVLIWEEYTETVDFNDVIVVLQNVRFPEDVFVPATSSATSATTSSTLTSATSSSLPSSPLSTSTTSRYTTSSYTTSVVNIGDAVVALPGFFLALAMLSALLF